MEKHLQIINPSYEKSFLFKQFPLLPAELRLIIWESSLRRHRLIEVWLYGGFDADQQYTVSVRRQRVLSKLLRVNSEARAVALRFYRVKLRCVSRPVPPAGEERVLHLNPEFDFLYIRKSCLLIAHFFTDLRGKDPLNVGVRNLALDLSGVSDLTHVPLKSLRAVDQAAFTQTMKDLHQVFFISAGSTGRMFLGRRSEIDTNTRFEYHRSRPIVSTLSTISSFDRLPRDPRTNIELDLGRVFMGTFNPRRMIYRWRCCLHQWGIQTTETTPEYRLLITTYEDRLVSGSRAAQIVDRDSALEQLRSDEKYWIQGTENSATEIVGNGGQVPVESPEEIDQAPKPAIGFWLFPIEALGPIPEPKEPSTADQSVINWNSRTKEFRDMRNHWPELCLTQLPQSL
ncbi:hypothetical protein GGR57DRAFT_204416 [Xylariaceae sp. FL1272]|nr:hypothetical protein GGR57DRAFT_204416 [Xylariaceae sp. FL1272]